MKILIHFSLGCLCALASVSANPASGRPLQFLSVDDVLNETSIEQVKISPNHTQVAYVRFIPTKAAILYDSIRQEVWVKSLISTTDHDESREVRFGGEGQGYVIPTWSPDGLKLAMYVYDKVSVRVAVWDSRTGITTMIDARDIPGRLRFNLLRSFCWADNGRLLLVMERATDEPDAQTGAWGAATRAYLRAMDAKAGMVSTAFVRESGRAFDPSHYAPSFLVLASMEGQCRVLASAVSITNVSPSPDGKRVAFMKREVAALLDEQAVVDANFAYHNFGGPARFTLEIVDLNGAKQAMRMGAAKFVQVSNAVSGKPTFGWASDSRSIAVLASTDEKSVASHLFRGRVDGTLDEVRLGPDVRATGFLWARDGLLVAGESADPDCAAQQRSWWLASDGTQPQLISGSLKSVPNSLVPFADGRVGVGVADGDAWRVDLSTKQWTNLTATFTPRVESVRTPGARGANPSGSRALLTVTENGTKSLVRVDVASGIVTPFKMPSASAEVAAYDGESDIGVFVDAADIGTSVTADVRGTTVPIVTVNEHLAQITPGKAREFTYKSEHGQELTGWLLLPPDYGQGKKYPMIVKVYAGDVYSAVPPGALRLNPNGRWGADSLQLFAAHGYAVLLPSMPLSTPEGKAADVLQELTNGVIPAVDAAIAQGIADPDRIAVIGSSFGGYSVFGLITQTNRFKAAIAFAGISDATSAWGSSSYNGRYDYGNPDPSMFGATSTEGGQTRMGAPPWKDPERYVRNSPIYFANRVQTPVLIVHGDQDNRVPLGQSEGFYTAMVRQGKRCRFIQYTGEGHGFVSPANICDLWHQYFDWLDEYLFPERQVSPTTQGH